MRSGLSTHAGVKRLAKLASVSVPTAYRIKGNLERSGVIGTIRVSGRNGRRGAGASRIVVFADRLDSHWRETERRSYSHWRETERTEEPARENRAAHGTLPASYSHQRETEPRTIQDLVARVLEEPRAKPVDNSQQSTPVRQEGQTASTGGPCPDCGKPLTVLHEPQGILTFCGTCPYNEGIRHP